MPGSPEGITVIGRGNKKEVKTEGFSPPGVGGVLLTNPLAAQQPALPGRAAHSLARSFTRCG